jgi:hypothetical protein
MHLRGYCVEPGSESPLDETQMMWGVDAWGRHEEPPLCAVAVTGGNHRVIVYPAVPRALARDRYEGRPGTPLHPTTTVEAASLAASQSKR